MPFIINVHDDLALRLQSAAKQRHLTAEALAITILDDAVPSANADTRWGESNKRRLELIRKSARQDLTEQEQAELDRLQNWLDERFESFDTGLLAQLDEMKQTITVRALPAASLPG